MRKSTTGLKWHKSASGLQRGSLLAFSIASALSMAGTAQAGEAPGASALEEIIVTAERRATTEGTTAISMNVLTGDDLAANRTQNIADLQQTTPNVTINQPGLFNSINIRGIGNSAIQPSITTGVAVFQDGLLNAETITLGGAFLDLGTAEVLRGPQGTFIGASSTGGAIRLNSVKPELNGVNGYVEGLVAQRSDVKVTGAINLPISDTFAARLAFNMEKRNSYFYSKGSVAALAPTNPFTQQGKVEDMNARVSLLWKPNDNFEAIWRSETNRVDNEGSPFQPNPRTFTNALGQQTHSRYWNYDDAAHDPEILSINTFETQNVGMVDRHSLEMNYKFGNDITLRSLTGLVHNENRYIEDQDGSAAEANIIRNDVGPDNDYYSQEFNLISPDGPFNWIVGASWFYRMTPVNLAIESATCGISPVDGSFTACPLDFNGMPNELVLVNSKTTTRSGGIFGQVNWKFTDTLEVTAGVRMNYDRNFSTGTQPGGTRGEDVQVVIPVPPAFTQLPACGPAVRALPQVATVPAGNLSCLLIGQRGEYEDETPTWKLGLNWRPSNDQFVYAFWSRGYKSGGIDAQGQFNPESVDDYELGWKGTFAGGRAQLSVGGFWMDYQDMQQSAYKATTTTAGNTVYNIGSSTIKGVEVELNAKLGGLGVNATAGYTQSELGSIRLIDRTKAPDSLVRLNGSDLRQCGGGLTTPCVDWTPYYVTVAGQSNIYSPELSYTLTLDYEIALDGGASLTPKVNFSHTDEQDTNLLKREAFYSIPKRDLMNVSLTYNLNDWLVQAYCNNCADKTYIGSVQAENQWLNVLYGAPRNVGLRFRRNF